MSVAIPRFVTVRFAGRDETHELDRTEAVRLEEEGLLVIEDDNLPYQDQEQTPVYSYNNPAGDGQKGAHDES